jgi:quercetin dioxygenase-like cupin family protein
MDTAGYTDWHSHVCEIFHRVAGKCELLNNMKPYHIYGHYDVIE